MPSALTTVATAPPPALPVQLTRFIGRARELEDLVRLLPSTRLLTLTGAGGSGKTRLAAEAAARVAPAFARVGWVDFAPLVDAALVPQHVTVALSVQERLGDSTVDSLIGAIGGDAVLLVLDNCEHLVDPCAELVELLLRGCPRLTVLATSREALGVPGETAWLVPPLAVAEATNLFVERAQAVLPTFGLTDANATPVTEICRRLDGIPLAIELAAARIRVLSPDQIAERLSDAFRLLSAGSRTALPRHRTLRGTMEWSYALLNPREQVLLRRLAVFASTFSLEAAEAVAAGDPLEADDILDGVTTLVDKSLLVLESTSGDARYRLLETVRQYGYERLREANEVDTLRARHADFFVALAEAAAPHLFGGAGDAVWLARVTDDSNNLRAVAEWATEAPERASQALRLGVALHWFWYAHGHFREGRERMNAAFRQSMACNPLLRGQALIALGHIALWQGDHAMIRPLMEESVQILRGQGDERWLAYALNGLGAAIYMGGDPATAAPYLDEALALSTRLPRDVLRAIILYWRGRVAQDLGDIGMAATSFKAAEQIGRELGHRPAIAHPLCMQGRLAAAQGDHDYAVALFAEGLAVHHEIEDRWGVAQGLEGIGSVAAVLGRNERATKLLAAADALRERIATPLSPAEFADRERHMEGLRKALGSRYVSVWNEGRILTTDDAVQLALAHMTPRTAEHPIPMLEPARPAGAATMTLRVNALGPLQVFRGDEAIDATAWGSARPRELLVFLLMHPDGCTKEQVGLAFWPEASSAQVRNSFHVTLHRVRKALGGSEWIVLNNDRYRLDPAIACEFDVALFERELTAARRALTRQEEGAVALLERALARYHGDFLDGEPVGDWHLTHRDRLQRLCMDGLVALGGSLIETERFPKAAEAFRRVLARDELHEEAWRQLMVCHARMGERPQALRLYQRLTDVLRKELDAEPDDETTALYERLQRGATA